MSLSMLLAEQICSFFIIIMIGAIAGWFKILNEETSKKITQVIIYIICPCIIIVSYQRDFSVSAVEGILLSAFAALLCHLLFIVFGKILKWKFGFSNIERANLIYTNCGNLTLPLVAATFGSEMVMYSSVYMAVQTFFVWTHGISMVKGEKSYNLKKVLSNINVIAIVIGVIFFVLGIKIPSILYAPMEMTGNMIGPLSMLCLGIVLSSVNIFKMCTMRCIFVVFIRLIIFPIFIVLAYVLINNIEHIHNSKIILTISLIAAAAPAAVTITQFAVLFNNDYKRSLAMNIISTIGCIFTIPFIVWLFDKFTISI